MIEFADEGGQMGSVRPSPGKAFAMHSITPRASEVDSHVGIHERSDLKVDFSKS
jgi:hypothetical protein